MTNLYSTKPILVTGADGFIGSHLTELLVRLGYNVRAFVQYNSFNSWGWLDECGSDVKGHFQVIAGDVRDGYGVKTALQDCQAVLHLAALIAIPYSYNSPEAYVDTNIKGTLNLLQASRELGDIKFIHTSTSEVYGTAQSVPINEKHQLNAQSPYAATKIAADQLVQAFHSSFELRTITIRPFNTYGPRQSARAVIPTIISQIAQGSKTIKLGALAPTRDFTHVLDTARGFVAALVSEEGIGETFNLGSNFEVSMGEAAGIIAQIMDREIILEQEDVRLRPEKSEVQRLWADNSMARDVLSWQPAYAGLDGFTRGLKETIDWFIQNKNLSQYRSDVYNL
jgi:NAD dependent epimerase/dehydratase